MKKCLDCTNHKIGTQEVEVKKATPPGGGAQGMVAMEVTGMDKAMVMVMMVDMEAMEDMGNSGEAGVTEAMTRIMDMATITTTITTELWMMDDQLTNDQGEYFCKVFCRYVDF